MGDNNNIREDTRLIVGGESMLLPFLLENLPKLARNNVKSLLTHRQVLVNDNTQTRHDILLHVGDEVIIHWGLVRNPKRTCNLLRILYEDEHLIIVEKPARMLTIATEKEKENTAYHILTDYVREKNPENRIFIVHRLDRDTSGILMFARNETVKRLMQNNWREWVEDRAYLALVEGKVTKKEGLVHSWLKESPSHMMYSCGENSGGLEAITYYRCIETGGGYSLMDIRLETGRKNQIRVHMKDLGHPIAGDKRYGAYSNPIGRLALHAYILRFKHPITGETMNFESEVPKAFAKRLHSVKEIVKDERLLSKKEIIHSREKNTDQNSNKIKYGKKQYPFSEKGDRKNESRRSFRR